jgi:hypothetical protein
MKTICAVYDRVAETFGQPMFVQNQGIAIRSFTDEVNRQDENNQLYRHADDFELHDLGVYTDSTANFQCYDKPKLLVTGKQVKISN